MLAVDQLELLLRPVVVEPLPSDQRNQRFDVADTAGVMEEMADGDRLAIVGQLFDVAANRVVERKLAVYLRRIQEDSHGGWPLYHDGDFNT